MSAKLVLSVAAGVVLGGGALLGIVGALSAASSSASTHQSDVDRGRRHAVSDAKLIGQAILMWAGDNDDYLPPKAKFRTQIAPYLFTRDSSADVKKDFTERLQRFDYRANTQKVTDVPKTEADRMVLGAMAADGGEAVAYYDGSARWNGSSH